MRTVERSGMRCAVWYGGEDIRVEERAMPAVGADDVLVRIVACGLCATDLHLTDGSIPLYQPPRILGHEVAGVVEAVGPVVRSVRPGDAVALETSLPCDTCYYCREQLPFMCERRRSIFAGFAEYIAAPERAVYRLPAGLPVESGALAEPVACCVHAVELAGIKPGSTAAVVGAGPIGLLLSQVLRLSGVTRLVAADLDAGRSDLAIALGATAAIDPAAEDLRAAVLDRFAGVGVDYAFEAVGAAATLEAAIGLVRKGGTVVNVGVAPGNATATIHPYDLFAREITIRFSAMRAYEFRRAVELLPALNLAPFLACRVPLERIGEAFHLGRTRAAPKVLVCP